MWLNRNVLLVQSYGLMSQTRRGGRSVGKDSGSSMTRGDRKRNAQRERLRGLLPRDGAVIGRVQSGRECTRRRR